MKKNYRKIKLFPAFLVVFLLFPAFTSFNTVAAADYPTKPIEIVVHSKPGGNMYFLAQLIADINQKKKYLPQPMFVTVKAGSGFSKAFGYLMEKKGDAYVVGLITSSHMLGTPLISKLPFSYKDFTPIANLSVQSSVVAVRAKGPYKTFEDIMDDARKRPKQLIQGGGSFSSPEAIMGRVLQAKLGLKWKYISFKTKAASVPALLGGDVDFIIVNPNMVSEHVRAGTVRLVLANTFKRYKQFPDVPTMVEKNLGRPLATHRALDGPPGMPKYAQKVLAAAAKKIVADDQFQKYLDKYIMQEEYMNPDELYKFYGEEQKVVIKNLTEGGMIKK